MCLQTYLDVAGLSPHRPDILAALCRDSFPGLVEVGEDERLELLHRLREGAGVRVITGPLGRAFWELASIEVIVEVWPDGYKWEERHEDVLLWALQAFEGYGRSRAGSLCKTPPKSVKHKDWAAFERAKHIAVTFDEAAETYRPIVVGATPAIGTPAYLEGLTNEQVYAQDWEWNPDTHAPIGLGIYTPAEQVYIPGGVGESWREALLRGTRVVLHNGRSDLGTQYPDDPVELVGKGVVDDTMVLAFLCGERELSLAALSKKYLGRELNKSVRAVVDSVAVETVARYCLEDCRATYDLYHELVPEVVATGQWQVYEDIERPLVPLVASMEKYGVPVDVNVMLKEYRDTVHLEQAMRSVLREQYGVDPRTDAGAREILTAGLGHDPGTLDQRVISMYPEPVVDLLLFYRQHRTRRRNFLKKHITRWVEAGKPDEFRLYPRYNQAGGFDDAGGKAAPRTGRFSSADPNIQQQPPSIRDMFVAPRGYLFWAYDYSGIELRLAAGISGDETMLAAIAAGVDIHGILQERVKELTGQPIVRTAAKRWNFGKLYGGELDKLIQILAKERVHLDRPTAQALDKAHADLFPGYLEWTGDWVRECRELGFARTLRGRVRLLPELYSDDEVERGNAERAAVNMAVQGLAADVMKVSMNDLVEVMARYGGHIAGTVHDEVFGWVPMDADVDGFQRDVKRVMEGIEAPGGVRLSVEGGTGRSWKEAK